MDTYYSLLGISNEAPSAAEIKTAWRDMLRQVHPDRVANAPDYFRRHAEEKTKEINEAYTVLSDPGKRRLYDAQLAAYRAANGNSGTQTPPAPAATTPPSPAPPAAATPATLSGLWQTFQLWWKNTLRSLWMRVSLTDKIAAISVLGCVIALVLGIAVAAHTAPESTAAAATVPTVPVAATKQEIDAQIKDARYGKTSAPQAMAVKQAAATPVDDFAGIAEPAPQPDPVADKQPAQQQPDDPYAALPDQTQEQAAPEETTPAPVPDVTRVVTVKADQPWHFDTIRDCHVTSITNRVSGVGIIDGLNCTQSDAQLETVTSARYFVAFRGPVASDLLCTRRHPDRIVCGITATSDSN